MVNKASLRKRLGINKRDMNIAIEKKELNQLVHSRIENIKGGMLESSKREAEKKIVEMNTNTYSSSKHILADIKEEISKTSCLTNFMKQPRSEEIKNEAQKLRTFLKSKSEELKSIDNYENFEEGKSLTIKIEKLCKTLDELENFREQYVNSDGGGRGDLRREVSKQIGEVGKQLTIIERKYKT